MFRRWEEVWCSEAPVPRFILGAEVIPPAGQPTCRFRSHAEVPGLCCRASAVNMASRNNNKLPSNLPQLQNLIKRDPPAYIEEVGTRRGVSCSQGLPAERRSAWGKAVPGFDPRLRRQRVRVQGLSAGRQAASRLSLPCFRTPAPRLGHRLWRSPLCPGLCGGAGRTRVSCVPRRLA